jgi:hypothetical protein
MHTHTHQVTPAEAAAGAYSVGDVVLPLPGRAVRMVYPGNAAGRRLRRLLDKEGVLGSVVDPAGGGAGGGGAGGTRTCLFRFLMERAVDLEWEVLPYVHDKVTHTHAHTHAHTCTHVHTCTHMHTHAHTCTHMHTHAHAHTHTQSGRQGGAVHGR